MPTIKDAFDQFHPLEKSEMDAFMALTMARSFKAGEVILAEGKIENYLSFIEQGALRTFFPKNGKEHHIDFGFEGQFCSSYSSFISRSPSKSVTAALEDTRLISISYDNLQLLYENSVNGERLGRLSAESLFKERVVHEVSLMLETPEERFNYLMENKKDWVRRVPQKYLASYLNITPETFSRLKRKAMQHDVATSSVS